MAIFTSLDIPTGCPVQYGIMGLEMIVRAKVSEKYKI